MNSKNILRQLCSSSLAALSSFTHQFWECWLGCPLGPKSTTSVRETPALRTLPWWSFASGAPSMFLVSDTSVFELLWRYLGSKVYKPCLGAWSLNVRWCFVYCRCSCRWHKWTRGHDIWTLLSLGPVSHGLCLPHNLLGVLLPLLLFPMLGRAGGMRQKEGMQCCEWYSQSTWGGQFAHCLKAGSGSKWSTQI